MEKIGAKSKKIALTYIGDKKPSFEKI